MTNEHPPSRPYIWAAADGTLYVAPWTRDSEGRAYSHHLYVEKDRRSHEVWYVRYRNTRSICGDPHKSEADAIQAMERMQIWLHLLLETNN